MAEMRFFLRSKASFYIKAFFFPSRSCSFRHFSSIASKTMDCNLTGQCQDYPGLIISNIKAELDLNTVYIVDFLHITVVLCFFS